VSVGEEGLVAAVLRRGAAGAVVTVVVPAAGASPFGSVGGCCEAGFEYVDVAVKGRTASVSISRGGRPWDVSRRRVVGPEGVGGRGERVKKRREFRVNAGS